MQSHVTPADPATPCTSLVTWGSTADPPNDVLKMTLPKL